MSKKIKAVICIAALAVSLFAMTGCEDAEEVDVIFDAPSLYYENDEGKLEPFTSDMVKDEFGKPGDTDSWNYENIFGEQYKMKTYYYDDFEVLIHNDRVLRVTFRNVALGTDNPKTVLKLFGLSKYSDTEENDTGSTYKATNVGIYEINAINYTDETSLVQLTYWDFPW